MQKEERGQLNHVVGGQSQFTKRSLCFGAGGTTVEKRGYSLGFAAGIENSFCYFFLLIITLHCYVVLRVYLRLISLLQNSQYKFFFFSCSLF